MSATHAPAIYPTAVSLDALSRHWPGTYPVPTREGVRAQRIDRNQSPPALMVSCVCGEWHEHPSHDPASPLATEVQP